MVSLSAPETSLNFSGSRGKILFRMGRTVTTGLLSLVPPGHIDDCSAIHFLQLKLCRTDVPSLLKKTAVKKQWVGARDGSKKLGQTTSDMETDTVLKKKDITDTIPQTEAGKEETAEANTEVIERIKLGSNKN